MVDQNHISDWKAYFAAMGPREPHRMTSGLEVHRSAPRIMLLINDTGGLMSTQELDKESFLQDAKDLWENRGKPEMWLCMEWPWGASNHIPSGVVKKKSGL